MPPFLGLPPEVTDEIISHIHGGRSLYSCALVCRSWTAASLYHLYMAIEIRSPRSYELLVRNVLRSNDMHSRLSAVHTVALVRGKALETTPQIPWNFILQFAGHLPSLRLLTLRSFLTPGAPHSSVFAALSSFSSVRELRLEKCHFASFGTLRRTLVSLPSLTAVQLRQVGWIGSSPQSPANDFLERRPKLRSLAIDANFESHRTFLPWLLRTPTRDSLRELSVTDPARFSVTDDLWKPFQIQFFETVAASVTTLSIIPEINFPMEAFTNLRHLSFYLQKHDSGPGWSWQRTCDMLRRVSSPLARVHFQGVPVEVVEVPIVRTAVPDFAREVSGRVVAFPDSEPDTSLFVDNRFRYEEWHALEVALADLRCLEEVSFSLTEAWASEAGRMVVSRSRVVGDFQDVFPGLRARSVRIAVTPEYFPKDDSDDAI
ncbi:hypothetical protein V8D89_004347 [Ganoderma adspersum]